MVALSVTWIYTRQEPQARVAGNAVVERTDFRATKTFASDIIGGRRISRDVGIGRIHLVGLVS